MANLDDTSRLENSPSASGSDTSLPQEVPIKSALSAKSTQFSITNLLGLEGASNKPSRGGSLSSNTSEDDSDTLQCGENVSGKQMSCKFYAVLFQNYPFRWVLLLLYTWESTARYVGSWTTSNTSRQWPRKWWFPAQQAFSNSIQCGTAKSIRVFVQTVSLPRRVHERVVSALHQHRWEQDSSEC